MCDRQIYGHAAGNYRILPTLVGEMLTVAARRDLGVLDEKLYLLDIRMTLVFLSKLLVHDIVKVCNRARSGRSACDKVRIFELARLVA